MEKNILSITETGAVPGEDATGAIQSAIDRLWQMGGGTVTVPAGKYLIRSIRLRSHVTLHLLADAQLFASRNPEDYSILKNDTLEPLPEPWQTEKCWEPFVKGVTRCYDFMKPGGRWGNAMIRAIGAEDVAIIGESGSVLDGQDCYDPLGEEGYRGPHGISMHHCRNVILRGYTIRNAGNWGHNINSSCNILADGVTVLAGHDGIHCTSCENLQIRNCSFYTGDDCIAGFANINTYVTDCVCNTACSGLRFGGTNALIRNCRFFGPARYFFRGSLSLEEKISGAQAHRPHRVNMLSVFTYYADFSVDIPVQPGNIVVEDCTAEQVDRFLHYNFSGNERWQSHRPLASVTFSRIRATGIGMPLTAYGSGEVPLVLSLRDVQASFREEAENTPFLHAANYDRILLENVTVEKPGDAPLIKTWSEGGQIVLRNVSCGLPEEKQICFTDEPFHCKSI